MSHLKQRKQTNCLNCNAEVEGRYCSVCGQENVEPGESAWHLIRHFFEDVTHFEGKFFRTLKLLFTKPGFLPNEYRIGRRVSYMNPVRLYIFTSFFFFLISFGLLGGKEDVLKLNYAGKTEEQINKMDSAQFDAFTRSINDSVPLTRQQFEIYKDTSTLEGLNFMKEFRSVEHYDSMVHAGKLKDNWMERLIARRALHVREKYAYQKGASSLFNVFKDKFVHSFPQMLIISLPLFALFLKWLYYRRRQFYYVSHAVYAIYHYVFIFIMILFLMLLNKAIDRLDWVVLDFIFAISIPGIFFYQYKSMRNFYGQGRGKTILKLLLLNGWLLFITILLFVIFSIFIFFKI